MAYGPLLSCLTIYLLDPKPFYVDYHDKMHRLVSWMLTKEELEKLPAYPGADAPDLCVVCGHFHGLTSGGRLRSGCYHCPEKVLWINTLAAYTNKALLTQIFHVTPACLEYHMALAYGLILERRSL